MAPFNLWPKESLQQFAAILAPLIAAELKADESRQLDANWQIQDIDRLKFQRRRQMAAERKSK